MVTALLGQLTALPGKVLGMVTASSKEKDEGEEEEGTTATAAPPAADPYLAQIEASVGQMKDTAKWTVSVFAALAAILIAGTQLSSLGQLEGNEWIEDHRLLVAFLAGGIALLAIGAVIHSALSVLTATPKSLDELATEEKESESNRTRDVRFVHASNLLEEKESIQQFNAKAATLGTLRDSADLLRDPDKIRQTYADVAYHNARIETFQATMRYETVRRALSKSRGRMLAAGLVGGLAIGSFTWAANPPKEEETTGPFLIPTNAYARLSEENQGKWADELGNDCVTKPIYVMVLSTARENAEVVTVTGTDCAVARMTISIDELFPVFSVTIPMPEPADDVDSST